MAFLKIEKLDAATGLPIFGAVYLLHQQNDRTTRIFTNENGLAMFRLHPNRHYYLSEGAVPLGYRPDNTVYDIFVCHQGTVLVDDIPIEQLVLLGYKKAEG